MQSIILYFKIILLLYYRLYEKKKERKVKANLHSCHHKLLVLSARQMTRAWMLLNELSSFFGERMSFISGTRVQTFYHQIITIYLQKITRNTHKKHESALYPFNCCNFSRNITSLLSCLVWLLFIKKTLQFFVFISIFNKKFDF